MYRYIILASNLHLIGNLPFNIASSFLVQWIKMLSDRSGIFKFSNITMTLMFQKEVGDVRIYLLINCLFAEVLFLFIE